MIYSHARLLNGLPTHLILDAPAGFEPANLRFAGGYVATPSRRDAGALGMESNLRPPAYKAGTLPTELRGRNLVQAEGIEPSTNGLSSRCSTAELHLRILAGTRPGFVRFLSAPDGVP